MADDYEERGYSVVRYSLEEEYVENKEAIAECDIVFIAVPTPTTPDGADHSVVEEAVSLTRDSAIVVIKSTIVPGTTRDMQAKYPNRTLLFSPEFLSKVSAPKDAREPIMNIIGVLEKDDRYTDAAKLVHETLPECEHNFTVSTEAAEHFKYIHNVHGYMRIVLANLFHDAASAHDVDWSEVAPMMNADPMLSPFYNEPIHKSGRGAGGCCFIKDFKAYLEMYKAAVPEDTAGIKALEAFEAKNLELLKNTDKDQDIVEDVYGKAQ